MNTINSTNFTFGSTKIPMNTKKSFLQYLKKTEPTELQGFCNKSVSECRNELLKNSHANVGILLGKDNCFYIFGKTNGQDEYIYEKLKNFDSNASYLRDFNDGLPKIEPIDLSII